MSNDENELTSGPRRDFPRFSLRKLIWVTVFVALVAAVLRLGYEVLPLRWEVERLRAEAGHLVIDTSHIDRLQAIGVTDYTDLTWKWKVYLPSGKKYAIKVKFNDIPEQGFPEGRVSRRFIVEENAGAELTLVFAIRKNVDEDGWDFVSERTQERQNTTHRGSVKDGTFSWMEDSQGSSSGGVSNFRTVSLEEKSLVLLRQRHMERTSPSSSSIPQDPAKGLMIWIEEIDSSQLGTSDSVSYE